MYCAASGCLSRGPERTRSRRRPRTPQLPPQGSIGSFVARPSLSHPITTASRPTLRRRVLRHRKRYVPRDRLTVGLVGHFDFEAIITRLERVFHRNPLAHKHLVAHVQIEL